MEKILEKETGAAYLERELLEDTLLNRELSEDYGFLPQELI